MRKVMIGLVAGALALAIGGQASATPQFDAVITQINGGNVSQAAATVTVSDTVQVTLTLSLMPVDVVGAASMPMSFDGNILVLTGPAAGPGTFHQPCSFTNVPCPIYPGASANSGAATTDSQAGGLVGAMGAASFSPLGLTAGGTGTLGVVEFHAGAVGVASVVVPFVQFQGVDGTFGAFGVGAVPFTIGNGVSITVNPIPEPTTALLVGLGLVGMATAGRRR